MKVNLDYKYLKRIKYTALGFFIIYFIYIVLSNLSAVITNIRSALAYIIKALSPFICGFIIAYIINPLVKWFEKYLIRIRINKRFARTHDNFRKYVVRLISLILTFVIILLVILAIIYSVFVMINGSYKDFEFSRFVNDIGTYISNFTEDIKSFEESLEDMSISTNIMDAFYGLTHSITNEIQKFLESLTVKLTSIGNSIINISFGFVFAFYFIMNREFFLTLIENFLRLSFYSDKKRNAIKEIFSEINLVFVNFIRAKIIDLTLMTFVTIVSLLIIKFNYAFIIGLFAGYTNIIPFLGTWIGIIPAMLIALITGGWKDALFIGLYIVVVQQIYYIVVSPKVQGKTIGMHPVFILLSIFAFGYMFGLVGIILSIPFGGIVRVFVLRWARHRQAKGSIELAKPQNNKL